MREKYIFGPVASRRLGVSLGVDLVKPKCCTLDCVYCEAGKTTDLTLERREYVPVGEVIAELDRFLAARPTLDYITFSGAGEPTLNSRIGDVVRFVKEKHPEYRLCLLTNGTLLNDAALRREVEGVDLYVPNFDASTDEELAAVNRPAPGVTVESLAEGIRALCREQPGKVVLELFIVPGVNDGDASIARFVAYIRSFGVAKVQLNTLDRPGCVDWIRPSDAANTRRFIAALEGVVPVEAVGRFRYKSPELCRKLATDEFDASILALIARRPATLENLVQALGAEPERVRQRIALLLEAGKITAEKQPRGEFYALP